MSPVWKKLCILLFSCPLYMSMALSQVQRAKSSALLPFSKLSLFSFSSAFTSPPVSSTLLWQQGSRNQRIQKPTFQLAYLSNLRTLPNRSISMYFLGRREVMKSENKAIRNIPLYSTLNPPGRRYRSSEGQVFSPSTSVSGPKRSNRYDDKNENWTDSNREEFTKDPNADVSYDPRRVRSNANTNVRGGRDGRDARGARDARDARAGGYSRSSNEKNMGSRNRSGHGNSRNYDRGNRETFRGGGRDSSEDRDRVTHNKERSNFRRGDRDRDNNRNSFRSGVSNRGRESFRDRDRENYRGRDSGPRQKIDGDFKFGGSSPRSNPSGIQFEHYNEEGRLYKNNEFDEDDNYADDDDEEISYHQQNYEPSIGSIAYQLRRDAKEEGYDLLYGIQVVANALSVNKRDSQEIFIQEGLSLKDKKDKAAIQRIFDLVEKFNIKKTSIPKHELNIMTDNRPHQGFVLRSSEMKFIDIRDAKDLQKQNKLMQKPNKKMEENSFGEKQMKIEENQEEYDKVVREHWLALDEVWDPQNLGALIRSSYFLGVKGIIVCSKNSANLSATVSKASAGSMELMSHRLFAAKNMVKFLQSCKEEGYEVIGTSLDSDSVELGQVNSSKPSIIVLGNEGSGLRTNVKRECTTNVKILGGVGSGSGNGGEMAEGCSVDSLNVSVTGGILMHHLMNM